MATTLSRVIIFLPIAFMTGYARKYVNSFGWTMAMATLVSLLVAFDCRNNYRGSDVVSIVDPRCGPGRLLIFVRSSVLPMARLGNPRIPAFQPAQADRGRLMLSS